LDDIVELRATVHLTTLQMEFIPSTFCVSIFLGFPVPLFCFFIQALNMFY